MKSLPSILTLGNLTSGMLAVIMAIHGEFALAVTMIWWPCSLICLTAMPHENCIVKGVRQGAGFPG